MMKLQRYDFEIIYTSGKYLVLVYALSCAPGKTTQSSTEEDVLLHVNMIVTSLPVSDHKLIQIADETKKDMVLKDVITNMQQGWKKGSQPQYYHLRSDLFLVSGMLLRNNRIVIPETMHPDKFKRIYEGHLGVEKYKRRT